MNILEGMNNVQNENRGRNTLFRQVRIFGTAFKRRKADLLS